MGPIRRFAVRGSCCSLMTNQNAEASKEPVVLTWRYTSTAIGAGAEARSSHSSRKSTPLTTRTAGISTEGATVREPRACAARTRSEHTDVATSMAGSAVKSSEVRKSASRVALPATHWADTAAAPSIAALFEGESLIPDNATRPVDSRNCGGHGLDSAVGPVTLGWDSMA